MLSILYSSYISLAMECDLELLSCSNSILFNFHVTIYTQPVDRPADNENKRLVIDSTNASVRCKIAEFGASTEHHLTPFSRRVDLLVSYICVSRHRRT
jgi:hypothetical protein